MAQIEQIVRKLPEVGNQTAHRVVEIEGLTADINAFIERRKALRKQLLGRVKTLWHADEIARAAAEVDADFNRAGGK